MIRNYLIFGILFCISISALVLAILAFNKNSREHYNDNYKVKDAKGELIELSPKWTNNEWNNLRKGQKIMTKIFKEFDRICRKYNLKYWAMGGTLIGAVRHNGWVPWDGDIDVVMEIQDFNKLKEIVDKELPKDYFFIDAKNPKKDKYYNNNNSGINKIRYKYAWYSNNDPNMWHHGIQLDIFILDNSSDMKVDIIGSTPIRVSRSKSKEKDSNKVIYPLKELSFEGFKIFVPNKYKEYLRSWLGKLPPPLLKIEDRIPHEGKISFNIPKIWKEKMYKHLY